MARVQPASSFAKAIRGAYHWPSQHSLLPPITFAPYPPLLRLASRRPWTRQPQRRPATPMTHPLDARTSAALAKFSACDISDALVRLGVRSGGFLPDIHLQHAGPAAPASPLIGTASTVLFALSSPPPDTPASLLGPSNIPPSTHWADAVPIPPLTTILILSQPPQLTNAVLGGIMAQRLSARQAAAVVVAGRSRDQAELRASGLQIWARGTSTVGAGAAARAWAVNVPLDLGDVEVCPGDVVVADAREGGVVVVPAENVEEVVGLLGGLAAADDKVKDAVVGGMSVTDAFAKFR